MSKIILTTTSSFGAGSVTERLQSVAFSGIAFKHNPTGRKLTSSETKEMLGTSGAIGLIAGTENLGPEQLRCANGLKALVRCGVGMDNVNVEAAKELGIQVSSTPEAPTQAVAELVVGLILSSLRNIHTHHASVGAGRWDRAIGTNLEGKLVGIIGCGRIGTRVGKILSAFGTQILGCDVRRSPTSSFQMVSINELLERADIITLHVPSIGEAIIDAEALKRIKPGALIINTARGSLVDEAAMVEAVKSKKVRYATDVFVEEPYKGPLAGLPGVLHVPHVASYTVETRERMEHEALDVLAELIHVDLGTSPYKSITQRFRKKPSLEAIFFDMDGVLLDSVSIKEEGFASIFPEATSDQQAAIRAYHRENGGMSRYDKIRYYLRELFPQAPQDDEHIETLAKRFGSTVAGLVAKCKEIEGATDVLTSLPCPAFLVSGTPETELRRIVAARQWTKHFAGTFGTPRRKPDILHDLITSYNLNPKNCLFVGDASGDLNAAEETGVRFLGVNVAFMPPPGVRSLQDLRQFWTTVAEMFAL